MRQTHSGHEWFKGESLSNVARHKAYHKKSDIDRQKGGSSGEKIVSGRMWLIWKKFAWAPDYYTKCASALVYNDNFMYSVYVHQLCRKVHTPFAFYPFMHHSNIRE